MWQDLSKSRTPCSPMVWSDVYVSLRQELSTKRVLFNQEKTKTCSQLLGVLSLAIQIEPKEPESPHNSV